MSSKLWCFCACCQEINSIWVLLTSLLKKTFYIDKINYDRYWISYQTIMYLIYCTTRNNVIFGYVSSLSNVMKGSNIFLIILCYHFRKYMISSFLFQNKDFRMSRYNCNEWTHANSILFEYIVQFFKLWRYARCPKRKDTHFKINTTLQLIDVNSIRKHYFIRLSLHINVKN